MIILKIKSIDILIKQLFQPEKMYVKGGKTNEI